MKFKTIATTVFIACLTVAAISAGVSAGGAADAPKYPYLDVALPINVRVADLVSRLTLDEKISILHSSAAAIPRFGIPELNYGNEALHGVIGPGKFTVFPQAIAMAATWDPDLIHTMATAISDEAWGGTNQEIAKDGWPGKSYHFFWSPNINMARDPRWGRTGETYGEDPFLTGRFAVAFVTGMQGDDPRYVKVVSTPKHFAANNEDHNRDYCNARISETALREYYFPGFRTAVVEGGAQSVMGAYNAVNGIPCTANKWLLTDVLRNEWGFNGYVVTDCGAPHLVFAKHRYVKSYPEAAAAVLNAGADVECGGDDILRTYVRDALAQGLVSESTIDRAITDAVTVRFRLGLFDPPEMNPYTRISPDVIGSPAHVELARQISRESIVLLKNAPVDGAPLLPLDAERIKSIAVTGRNASVLQFGDYSGSPINTPVTPLDGIKNKVGDKVKVTGIDWIPAPDEKAYSAVNGDVLHMDSKPDAAHGIKAEYFDNADFAGTPKVTRVENEVNLKSTNVPAVATAADGAFSVRWSGKLIPAASGAHFFYIDAPGARMYLDGKLVFQRVPEKKKKALMTGGVFDAYLADTSEERKAATLMLEAGKAYDLTVEYASPKGTANVNLVWAPPAADIAAARAAEMKAVKESDVVIAFIGLQLGDEHETFDRHTLDISNDQTEYVKQLLALNPNVVVVLINGGALSVNWIAQNAPALLEAWYPGEQGGNGIADVLFGDYNPGARLPYTMYKSVNDLPPFDDYEVSKGRTYMYFDKEPLFPFGYGLSYTTFGYGSLALDRKRAGASDTLNASVSVENTGARDGDEVVQLYVRDVNPAVKRPIKRLRGFKRIHLKKGETQTVTIPIAVKDLAYWDTKEKKFAAVPGDYEILVGASSSDIRLKDTFTVTGE
jgi:beta-glucosidase